MCPDKKESSSPGYERLSNLKVPEVKDLKIVILKLADGRVVARNEEEISDLKSPEAKKKGGK